MTGPPDPVADQVAPVPQAQPEPPPALAERVAAAVRAHPGVAELHAGTFGDVATYLPGRRLIGVRIGAPGEPVTVGVVLTLDRPIPERVRSLRELVSRMCNGAPVDIMVSDVLDDEQPRTVTG